MSECKKCNKQYEQERPDGWNSCPHCGEDECPDWIAAAHRFASEQKSPCNPTRAEVIFWAAFQQSQADNERLREALEHIQEYWNGDGNNVAMSDALSEILRTCEQALAKGDK